MFGLFFFIAFMLGIDRRRGGSAIWRSWHGPIPSATPDGLEWYPAGHLVFWAAVIGAAIVIAAMLSLGNDLDTFRASFRTGLERM